MLAAAALLALLTGLAAPISLAETRAEPERPRNRLSPTDETELPPLAPPQPLIPRGVDLPKEPGAPRAAPPPPEATPMLVVEPAIKSAQKSKATPQPLVPRRIDDLPKEPGAPRAAPPAPEAAPMLAVEPAIKSAQKSRASPTRTIARTATAAKTTAAPKRIATAARTPRQDDYYFAPTWPDYDGAPCPTRSSTSLGELFACTLR